LISGIGNVGFCRNREGHDLGTAGDESFARTGKATTSETGIGKVGLSKPGRHDFRTDIGKIGLPKTAKGTTSELASQSRFPETGKGTTSGWLGRVVCKNQEGHDFGSGIGNVGFCRNREGTTSELTSAKSVCQNREGHHFRTGAGKVALPKRGRARLQDGWGRVVGMNRKMGRLQDWGQSRLQEPGRARLQSCRERRQHFGALAPEVRS